jgi:type IV pilus assembly protein PilC
MPNAFFMKRFTFKAKDEKGTLLKGEVEAPNADAAAKLVRKKGLVVIEVQLKGQFALPFSGLQNRVSGPDLANFTRQMSTMVNSGLPITESLIILRQGSKPALSAVVSQILADVEQGQSLSSSMEKHQKIFSKAYIALIRAGETGGVLDTVLSRLADDLEKQEEFKGKVKGALVYPVIIVVGMMIVGFIMMAFVIPKLTSLYTQFGADLPISTKILIFVSHSFERFWALYLFIIFACIYAFRMYQKTPLGARKLDELMLKIPVMGKLQQVIILTDLTRTLSLMSGSGVSIIEGLTITATSISNRVVSEALMDVSRSVEKGFPLAYSFAKHPEAFPFILSQMIAVGEETGKIDEVLGKVSHVFEVESEQQVKALTVALEPTILILLGFGVAFLIIAIILPIYNLTTKI